MQAPSAQIARFQAEHECSGKVGRDEGQDHAGRDTERQQRPCLAKHHRHDGAPPRSERHSNADLGPAPCHQLRHDSVESDCRNQDRQHTEEG